MAQGLQRQLDAQGRVGARKQPSDALMVALGPSVSVFLSEVETVRRNDHNATHATTSKGCRCAHHQPMLRRNPPTKATLTDYCSDHMMLHVPVMCCCLKVSSPTACC